MLQLDDFFYCKSTNTCCMDLVFRNLFCCQRWFLRIETPVILTFFNTGTYALSVRCTPNQNDSNVTFSRSCDQEKIIKRIERQSGLRKTVFLKKKQPTCFLFVLIRTLKRKFFFFFYEKRKNLILHCFYCIMQYHHFQIYTIVTCYTYYGIQIWG